MPKLKEFGIYWEGTVTGYSVEKGKTLEDAMERARNSDNPIEIKFYPEDWNVDNELTLEQNGN